MFDNTGFLTPVSLWKNFNCDEPLQASKIGEMRYDSIVYGEYYFSGRTTKSGRVRIYGLYVTPNDSKKHSAILYIPEITEKVSYEQINEYAKLGYCVLAVDLYGKRGGGEENFTSYPEDVSYANYENRGRHLDYVDTDATETSVYEWVAVCKYALKFLRSMEDVDRIGVVGVKEGANLAWQIAATENDLSLAVMMFGAGWSAYRGIHKYSDKDIVMDDERRKFIAAVDAHAYAQYVKCPILYLTATNSDSFDFDRANDTLARINPETEYSFSFAPNFNSYLDEHCKKDIEVFLSKYFNDSVKSLAKAPKLVAEQSNSYISFDLYFDEPERVEECKVFLNEGVLDPSVRNWVTCQVADSSKEGEGEVKFDYVISGNPEQIFALAVVKYKDGTSVCSKLMRKKTGGILPKRANLIYSGKSGIDGITFYDKNSQESGIFVNLSDCIQMVKGADGISGVYSRFGLVSYKFGEPACRMDENSIIKLDVYNDEYCNLKITMVSKSGEDRREFYYTKELDAGNIWKNIVISINEFKTPEGMGIRNFDEIFALRIYSESKYAINNILLI